MYLNKDGTRIRRDENNSYSLITVYKAKFETLWLDERTHRANIPFYILHNQPLGIIQAVYTCRRAVT